MNFENVVDPIIAIRMSQYPEDNKNEFLLVGRSNVGKSSFINSIVNRKNFAYIGNKPGKTQTLNFYLVDNSFYLVDVPGYGYANVSKQIQKKFGLMIEEYIMNRKNLTRVFMLIDFRHKPTEDDLLMYNYLKYYKLKVTIVATKYDKVSSSMKAKQEQLIKDTLDISLEDNIVLFSSLTKKGKEDIQNIILEEIKGE